MPSYNKLWVLNLYIFFSAVTNFAVAQISISADRSMSQGGTFAPSPQRSLKPKDILKSSVNPLNKSAVWDEQNSANAFINNNEKPIRLLKRRGGTDGGGGDSYTLDFVQTVALEIYPHAKKNPDKYKVTAIQLLETADPERVVSRDKVYESCDDSETGREVEVCYNRTQDIFQVSRSKYRVDKRNSASKRGLIVHELYRRLKVEGDQYEHTKLQSFHDDANDELIPLLSAKTRMKNETGITEIVTNDWVKVNPNDKLRLVVKSNPAFTASIGVKFFKQVTSDRMDEVGSGEVLDFSSELRKSKEFSLEPGFKYVIAFQGNLISLDASPAKISLRLENQDGRSIIDFGEILIQYKGQIQKPIRCGTQAYEIVEGIVNPSSTLINGSLHIQAEGSSTK